MKVLFIHQNFPGQFKHLAPALAAQGHEVTAVGINQPSAPTPGVRIFLHKPQVPANAAQIAPRSFQELQTKVIRGVSAMAALTRLKKEEGLAPDLIFAHSGWGETFFVKDLFPAARMLVYAEYYFNAVGGDVGFDPEFTSPESESSQLMQLKNLNLAHALVQADRGVSPTHFQRERHPPILRERIEVIHDGIETTRFVPSQSVVVTLQKAGLTFRPGDEVVTFTVRQLEPYRGYHSFMRALPELMSLRPQAHVVIAGGDDTSYGAKPPPGTTWKDVFLKEVAGRIDMKRLHYVGRIPHNVLTQLMQVSAAHVYLTYPFVLSWSTLEAMSCGCLVVGSRTAPVEEVIEHGVNGLLVDFFDPAAIARTVADALARREELAPLREAARRTIVERFDLQSICLPRQIDLVLRTGRGE
ncbi:MAG TPA: glycosyltransferase [Ramlibacter sp.]|uniref:glycosyltransferase n=1 Tax=Ramlibacter sp. TaxID=1917967 RepID=UPI002C10C925|nr:glycosyltransferase [Ramlibacter sp.]HVZ43703.1 glycosyltransferase [Ramlibacter sp.]